MRIESSLVLAVAAMATADMASAADTSALKKVMAAEPVQLRPFEAGMKVRAVKFARVVVQLKPEPWAFVRINGHVASGAVIPSEEQFVSWDGGRQDVKLSAVSSVFGEEMQRAGVPLDSAEDSLFNQNSAADLHIGVKVTSMSGRFCQYCERFNYYHPTWTGSVVMSAHWEIYSSLDRKVMASIDTQGGFNAPKQGVEGDPDILINEAFRDNVRSLVNSQEFRRIVTGPVAPVASGRSETVTTLSPISFAARSKPVPVPQATNSVAVIYAADGAGSGFLVSGDGYVLTNQHVVGGSKYVKLKWSNGAETLGEVIRADARRDVALIRTDAQGRAPLSLRPGPVQQGEPVFAIGTPLQDNLQNTMTRGIVSAERVEKGLRFIQSDAGINHGNSGGPLLDAQGAVIAITVSGILPDNNQMGLNFFIPIDDALKALSLNPVAAAPAPAAPARPAKPKG